MQSIDEVLAKFKYIVDGCQEDNDKLGYFPALYMGVTARIKEEISRNSFEDSKRMERFVISFANMYFEAYHAYLGKDPHHSLSWRSTFQYVDTFWPIVFQHLLAGMNTHINLDLGVATAKIDVDNIDDFKNDFNRINEILSRHVEKVQEDLAEIWPGLRFLLRLAGRADDYLIDFSMKKARDGAWKFAKELHATPEDQQEAFIKTRDEKVSKNLKIISKPGFFVSFLFMIIRVFERGSRADKIARLRD
ncbi:DUF5995 family protein [Reichenbachiella ulvae]|uniref:DUF5995 family protein n=1 Tax=Reichenbachiella ulvae TaxID=2980104 RepID=A0ABT3CW37_9BACT|nr:DUF5995 family protein [Reichenbachiella ulvae]MCV9387781.1 DUF5995 family protein [Reichenbachiella ulvae]